MVTLSRLGGVRSLEQFAAECTGFPAKVEKANIVAVSESCFVVKKAVNAQLAAAGLKGGRMRGVGKKGAKVGVRYDVKGRINPTGIVRMFGPAHLLESDTKAHDITPKASRGRKGAKALNIHGVGPRMSAHHPGTKGKHPFQKGVAEAAPLIPQVFEKAVFTSMVESFG